MSENKKTPQNEEIHKNSIAAIDTSRQVIVEIQLLHPETREVLWRQETASASSAEIIFYRSLRMKEKIEEEFDLEE